MIRSISFENYKSFKDRTTIDIKPITVFVGPNSSGKSSIIALLRLLHESLMNKTGQIIKVADFVSLIHRGETDELSVSVDLGGVGPRAHEMKLSCGISLDGQYAVVETSRLNWDSRKSYSVLDYDRIPLANHIEEVLGRFKSDIGKMKDIYRLIDDSADAEERIRSVIREHLAALLQMKISFRGLKFACSIEYQSAHWYQNGKWDELRKSINSSIDILYYYWALQYFSSLKDYEESIQTDPYKDILSGSRQDLFVSSDEMFMHDEIFVSPPMTGEEEQHHRSYHKGVAQWAVFNVREDHGFGLEQIHPLEQCRRILLEQPDMARIVELCLSTILAEATLEYLKTNGIGSDCFEEKELNAALENSLHEIILVPPIRPRLSQTGSRTELSSIIGPDNITSNVRAINRVLDHLNLGYTVVISEASPKGNFVIRIRDKRSGTTQDYDAVGYGISQVVPIIAALFQPSGHHDAIVAIEQPELHLHPKVQTDLAKIFSEQVKRLGHEGQAPAALVLETHSEHLVRGFQVQVAKGELAPADVAIYYIDKNTEGNSTAKRMQLDERGLFMDAWPEGFFDQTYAATRELVMAVARS